MWLILLAILLTSLGLYLLFSPKNNKRKPITGKKLLTERESQMFFRLKESVPEHIIFAQVSFNALMTAEGFYTRNLFNRKMVDFVVLNQKLQVIAVIELDDSSHDGREHIDAERDMMLIEAGYSILRYNYIPNSSELRKQILKLS